MENREDGGAPESREGKVGGSEHGPLSSVLSDDLVKELLNRLLGRLELLAGRKDRVGEIDLLQTRGEGGEGLGEEEERAEGREGREERGGDHVDHTVRCEDRVPTLLRVEVELERGVRERVQLVRGCDCGRATVNTKKQNSDCHKE